MEKDAASERLINEALSFVTKELGGSIESLSSLLSKVSRPEAPMSAADIKEALAFAGLLITRSLLDVGRWSASEMAALASCYPGNGYRRIQRHARLLSEVTSKLRTVLSEWVS